MNPEGSPSCGEGQASIEWKAGTVGGRTHLALGFEQNPRRGMDRRLAGVPAGSSAVGRYIPNCFSVSRYCAATASSESGMTLTWPTTVMKLVSPAQRGIRWAWR